MDRAVAASPAGQGAWAAAGPGPAVLYTGIGWEDLPQELGFDSGLTGWRRVQRWTDAGVFDQVHQIPLARLNAANRIDWNLTATDGSHIDAEKGCWNRPIAGQPRKPGSKHQLICAGTGTAIYVWTSGADIPDISRALDLLDGYAPIAGCPGRPRRRFAALLADKAYRSEAFRRWCRDQGIEPITRGIMRYVVE